MWFSSLFRVLAGGHLNHEVFRVRGEHQLTTGNNEVATTVPTGRRLVALSVREDKVPVHLALLAQVIPVVTSHLEVSATTTSPLKRLEPTSLLLTALAYLGVEGVEDEVSSLAQLLQLTHQQTK